MDNSETNREDSPAPPVTEIESKAEKIIVIQDKSKQPLIANIIALMAVIISGFLFYYTYQLFNETQKATAASQTSADAATNAVAEQKKMDSFSIDTQQNSSYQDSVNQDKNFRISQNALQIQINSLKQAQVDFENENRAVVTISMFYYSQKDIKNNIVNMRFSYFNIGKFPAKNIFLLSSMGIGSDTMHIINSTTKTNFQIFEYLGGGLKSDTLVMHFETDLIATVAKKNSFFVFMDLYYECPILKQKYHDYMVYKLEFTSMEDATIYSIQNKEEIL
jgi:hypothetical protein